jgi:diaminopimelate decarboxylase
MTRRSAAPPPSQFAVADDCLQIGGVSLTKLAKRVGRTPFYAYDRSLMTERVQLLRDSLPRGIVLLYAMKANPMPAVMQHMVPLVDGLDVASAGELSVAMDTGISPSKISFAGPAKMDWELAQAIGSGVTLNLESEGEMERAARIGERLGIRPSVAVRVNPDFEVKASGMRMGGGSKPFGVDAERVPAMLKRIGELALEFTGFHIYWGSQNLRPEAIIEAQNQSIGLAYRLAPYAPSPVRLLNIGGGFGIPLFPGDEPLDLAPIGGNLEKQLAELRSRLPEARLAIELGRFLVGEAGIYVCEVIDRKISRGQVFLVTNGGLHHHLAASGNFGQVVRKNYPVLVGNKVRGHEREIVSVVGPLCTPLDILASRAEMAVAGPGELVVVFQSGAYGLTVSPTAFLSHLPPAEVLV